MLKKQYRKRYILFEIISDNKINWELVKNELIRKMKELFGEFGLSEAKIKFFNELKKDKKYVLSIDHRYVQKIKLAMALVRKINRKPVIFKTIKVSGTLKKIKREVR